MVIKLSLLPALLGNWSALMGMGACELILQAITRVKNEIYTYQMS